LTAAGKEFDIYAQPMISAMPELQATYTDAELVHLGKWVAFWDRHYAETLNKQTPPLPEMIEQLLIKQFCESAGLVFEQSSHSVMDGYRILSPTGVYLFTVHCSNGRIESVGIDYPAEQAKAFRKVPVWPGDCTTTVTVTHERISNSESEVSK
jgi:hypothetical protein